MAELRFGPAGVPLSAKKRDTLSGIQECAKLGLEALEVEFVRGVKMGLETAKACCKLATNLDISLSTHAPYFINLASEDKSKRKKGIDFILQTAEIAHTLGAGIVVFHPGFYGKKPKEQCYELVKESISSALEVIKKRKWNVLLAPEVMGRQAQFGRLEEIIKLCEELTGITLTLDFAHLHARCNGCLRKREDFKKILDEVEGRLSLKELHIHFTGVEYKNGNEKKHLTLDQGDLDFKLLANELKNRKINATVISESPILEKDALEMKRIWGRV